jgi:hypothetical protein
MMIKATALSCAAAFALAIAPTAASAGSMNVSFNNLDIPEDDDEFFADLVELDASDIDDLREELAEAREEMRDALDDIAEAKEDVRDVPGGGLIAKMAMSAASVAVSTSVDGVLDEVVDRLDTAEARLRANADGLDAAEIAETQEAIDVIRAGLADIEDGLEEIVVALRA